MRIEQTGYRGVEFQSGSANNAEQTQTTAKANDLIDLNSPLNVEQAGGDLRADRIADVRDRIASGFYNLSSVREEIASAFLDAQKVGSF